MTKLPWQHKHNRSRTRSGGNKNEGTSGQEWFSRTGGEPSRQALTDLLKEHKREKSSGSSGSRTHSRTNTISSLEWKNNPAQSDVGSEAQSSRSTSPVDTREGSLSSALERPDSSTKNLLAKGSQLLRRKGSKMSLSSAGSSSNLAAMASSRSSHNPISPTGVSHAQVGDLRKAIGAPYDFKHITHAEQNQFSGLSRIEESELTQQYTAATNARPASCLQGIQAETIGVAQSTPDSHVAATSNTERDYKATQLPTTPPRPSPPPKDILVASALSTDLVSARPSPSLSVFPQAQLEIEASNTTETEGHASASRLSSVLDSKPLPQLPTVIHAVSTGDDTARTMIAAPLPSPPGSLASNPTAPTTKTFHRPQKSSVTLRPGVLSPSTKSSMPNLLNHTSLSTPVTTLPRHRSDLALSEQARAGPDKIDLDALSQMHLESADWETAIDEAWDSADPSHPEERLSYQYAGSDMSLHASFNSDDGGISTVSTPLMMAPPKPDMLPEPPVLNADSNKEGTRLSVVPEQRVLTGLGISQTHGSPPISAPSRASAAPSIHLTTKRSTGTFGSLGTLSRSSSQESMLMSHASSVFGTQRSSNSSVGDYESLAPGEKGFPMKFSNQSSLQTVAPSPTMSTTRPESGCLPPDIIQQLATTISTATASQPDSITHSHTRVNTNSSHQVLVIPESPTTAKNTSPAFPSSPRSPRRRSNGSGIRPRTSSRVSYSLFPMPHTAPATQPTFVNS